MYFGSRLAVIGVFFGSIFLSIFLLRLSDGLQYPSSPVRLDAAGKSASVQPVPEQSSSSSTLSNAPEYVPVDCAISSNFPAKVRNWCDLITQYANQRGLPPDLVAAVIWQESGGNPGAYSKSGAVGLMQVMPRDGIAASFMCVNGPCFKDRPTTSQLQDPEFNISYGTKMLASLLNRRGNLRDALKSYGPMDVGYYYADIVLGLFQKYGNQ